MNLLSVFECSDGTGYRFQHILGGLPGFLHRLGGFLWRGWHIRWVVDATRWQSDLEITLAISRYKFYSVSLNADLAEDTPNLTTTCEMILDLFVCLLLFLNKFLSILFYVFLYNLYIYVFRKHYSFRKLIFDINNMRLIQVIDQFKMSYGLRKRYVL